MKRTVATCVALALWIGAGGAARAEPVAFALVIGNNTPPDGVEDLAKLRYADDDAVRYYQLLSQFADTHLLAVLDESTQRRYPSLAAVTHPPTVAALGGAVAQLAGDMAVAIARGDEPVLYIAFSGHGARDEQGGAYLALLDGRLTQTTLFDDVIGVLPAAYTHLIIDACHAGGVLGVRGDGMFGTEIDATVVPIAPDELLPTLSSALDRHPTVGAIVATAADQTTHEWSELEAGVFTHEVISGLLGAADVNGDRHVEYTEVAAFVAAANREIRDDRAVPHVITHAPRSNRNARLVSLDALSKSTFLFGDAGPLGHFYLELDNGQRYLDAHLGGDVTAAVAIPAGARVFVRSSAGDTELTAREPFPVSALALAEPDTAARGALESALRDGLFAAPYTAAYYQGYVDSRGAVGVSFTAERIPPPAAPVDLVPPDRPMYLVWIAAGAGVASLATGALAWKARRDFDDTDVQVEAQDAARRYSRYGWASVASGVVAIASGAAAWWLWPRAGARVDVDVSSDGAGGASYTANVSLSW